MDTYVALPMLRDDALKASRYPILQRFSPVKGNLSVRSPSLSVGARESKFFFLPLFCLLTRSPPSLASCDSTPAIRGQVSRPMEQC